MLQILQGGVLTRLRELPAESVQCCVTSPPYWGLRDYGTASWEGGDEECDHVHPRGTTNALHADMSGRPHAGNRGGDVSICQQGCGARRIDSQLGLEKTPEEYVARMVEVFREVRRVLRKDGTLWLNMGDSYAGSVKGYEPIDQNYDSGYVSNYNRASMGKSFGSPPGLKPKDLVGIPWRVAFALQADGWWLRQDIIWAKPNPMPESVTDRCTKAHEYIFLLTKNARYFYDAEVIKEHGEGRLDRSAGSNGRIGQQGWKSEPLEEANDRNKRSVWTIATQPYPEAHFATFPEEIPKLAILAGTSAKGSCGECGTPWKRIVADAFTIHDGKTKSLYEKGTNANRIALLRQAARAAGGSGKEYTGEKKTIGWQPTCKCFRQECRCCTNPETGKPDARYCDCTGAEPIYERLAKPCTVLDPFAGSGTVGKVAIELARKAILIELNPKYVELIRRRCDVTPGFAF